VILYCAFFLGGIVLIVFETVPYSGGSSLEGNFSAPYGGFCIDFAFMDKILALHDDDLDVVVQPSIGWMKLNEEIKDSGLFFPVVSQSAGSEHHDICWLCSPEFRVSWCFLLAKLYKTILTLTLPLRIQAHQQ
jgi:hypothetical protein